jgi:hypothetical protein
MATRGRADRDDVWQAAPQPRATAPAAVRAGAPLAWTLAIPALVVLAGCIFFRGRRLYRARVYGSNPDLELSRKPLLELAEFY